MFELIECLANIATFCTLFVGVYQLWTDRKRAKRMATLEAYEKLQKEAFDVMNKWMPSEIKQVCEDKQSDDYKDLSSALAKVEMFCTGLSNKVYDMKVFRDISHGYFDDNGALYRRMMPLMESKLECAKEDYFQGIHWALKRMRRRGFLFGNQDKWN